ncbi:MAG: hypothetical protein GAK37_02456 [Pseudomonas sp.]|nr:MAG: hypothetical protein GAK37_02456 [Pseudomonas sp.]
MSRPSGLDGLTPTNLATLYRKAADWPLPGKVALGCGVACLVMALGNALLLEPSREQLRQQQAREVVLAGQVSQKSMQVAEVDALERQLQDARATFAGLLRELPVDTQMPGLLEDITRLGATHGLVFDTIKLLDELPQALYVELPVQVGVTGRYHDLAGFVSGLGGLSRAVTVQSLALHAGQPRLHLEFVAKTYRYTPQGDQDLPLQAGDADTPVPHFVYDANALRDPFQPPYRQPERPAGKPAAAPDPNRLRGVLEGKTFEQLQMVGTLSRGSQVFALLHDGARVHRLAVGDYLGPDHGRITLIDDTHIELAELFPDGEGAWLERSRTLPLTVNS